MSAKTISTMAAAILVGGTVLASAANAASVHQATTTTANRMYAGDNSGPINTGRDACEGHRASAAPVLGCNDGGF
jgi:hypothetical protein